MPTQNVLLQVRSLISVSRHWCKGSFARKADGTRCPSIDENAVSYSLLGAIDRIVGLSEDRIIGPSEVVGSVSDATDALGSLIAEQLGYQLPSNELRLGIAFSLVDAFNDLANHTDVLALIDKAVRAHT